MHRVSVISLALFVPTFAVVADSIVKSKRSLIPRIPIPQIQLRKVSFLSRLKKVVAVPSFRAVHSCRVPTQLHATDTKQRRLCLMRI